jgi:hypothetical protein
VTGQAIRPTASVLAPTGSRLAQFARHWFYVLFYPPFRLRGAFTVKVRSTYDDRDMSCTNILQAKTLRFLNLSEFIRHFPMRLPGLCLLPRSHFLHSLIHQLARGTHRHRRHSHQHPHAILHNHHHSVPRLVRLLRIVSPVTPRPRSFASPVDLRPH